MCLLYTFSRCGCPYSSLKMAAMNKDVEFQLCPEGLEVPQVGGKVIFQLSSMT